MTNERRVRLGIACLWIQIAIFAVLFVGNLVQVLVNPDEGSWGLVALGALVLAGLLLLRFGPGHFYAPETALARLERKNPRHRS